MSDSYYDRGGDATIKPAATSSREIPNHDNSQFTTSAISSRNNKPRSQRPDFGSHFLPGAVGAPSHVAPESHDHYKRGYNERASLRDRDVAQIDKVSGGRPTRDMWIQGLNVNSLVIELCKPDCNIRHELDKARDSYTASFDSGRASSSLISLLGRRRNMDVAMVVWKWSDAVGISPTVYMYNSIISACEKTKNTGLALRLLGEMEAKNVTKNEVTYSSAIAACEKQGKFHEALHLLNEMRSLKLQTSCIPYNCCISACEKGMAASRAMDIFETMKNDGIQPNVVTYSALISAAEKSQQWKLALKILHDMRSSGLGTNVVAYSAAISALAKGGLWEEALSLFRELQESSTPPNVVTYNATITALEKGLQWERALDLFEEMKAKGMAVTHVSYGAALAACEKGQQYRQCLAYLDEMTQVGLKKNVIIFGVAMSCMEKCRRADIAFQLLERMKMEGIQPNVHVFNSAITACARSGLWSKGYELFLSMDDQCVKRDIVTYNAVLDATCSQIQLARKLFHDGVQRGFYAKVSRLGSKWLELDLHFLSLGGGEIALVWWFEECLVPYLSHNSSKLRDVESINIVTGYGRTRIRGTRVGLDGMRKRVQAMLRCMNMREIEQPNKGRIQIDKASLEAEALRHGGRIIFDRAAYLKFKEEETTENEVPDAEQIVRPKNPPKNSNDQTFSRRSDATRNPSYRPKSNYDTDSGSSRRAAERAPHERVMNPAYGGTPGRGSRGRGERPPCNNRDHPYERRPRSGGPPSDFRGIDSPASDRAGLPASDRSYERGQPMSGYEQTSRPSRFERGHERRPPPRAVQHETAIERSERGYQYGGRLPAGFEDSRSDHRSHYDSSSGGAQDSTFYQRGGYRHAQREPSHYGRNDPPADVYQSDMPPRGGYRGPREDWNGGQADNGWSAAYGRSDGQLREQPLSGKRGYEIEPEQGRQRTRHF